MYREFKFAPDEYYHVYNRGTDKRDIFIDPKDYTRFVESLYLFNSEERIVLKMVSKKDRFSYDRGETVVNIGAYCLMPNHFHLLIRAKNDEGVSSFMKKLQTAYAMYFNKKYKRSGSLFQGPFKAQHAGRDEYLKYLFSYVHLNPIKLTDKNWKEKGIQDFAQSKIFLNSYKHSSYLDYLEDRQEASVLNKEAFPEYFENTKNFDDFIGFWLAFKNGIEKYTL
ncbi:MAG: transposase [Candidatus Paceibacterota bacterium]|jgi:putative transposase